jgi:hypothetical protein
MNEFDKFLADLKERLPEHLRERLLQPHAADELVKELPSLFPPARLAADEKGRRTWELTGLLYLSRGRHHDAIAIFNSMLKQMYTHQDHTSAFVHKGVPLVWLADCYQALGYRALAKRFLMLTLCEDAIECKGRLNPSTIGVYHRLVWQFGLPHKMIQDYAVKMAELASKKSEYKLFPEASLLDLDSDWQTEIPTAQETTQFVSNTFYIRHLMRQLGDDTGTALERLAHYLMSCIPGIRVARRKKTYSTDHDLVCAVDGSAVDFRSELGRYFVCECKDWNRPADFTSFAKFCRVLDSVKARFGIFFSKNGISGARRTTDAVREQLKVFQDRGLIIVALDKGVLKKLAEGKSLIAILRHKYELIRLDLRPS